MNYEHIDALLLAGTPRKWMLDGVVLATQGSFLLVYGGKLDLDSFDNLESIGKLWAKLQAEFSANPAFLEVGDLHKSRENHYRKIGTMHFDEAFVRCFQGASFFASLAGTSKGIVPESVGVVIDGALVGIVMKVHSQSGYEPIISDVPDSAVFAPFAREENGFYLQSNGKLREQLRDLEGELCEALEKLGDAEDEVEELRLSIAGLKMAIEGKTATKAVAK